MSSNSVRSTWPVGGGVRLGDRVGVAHEPHDQAVGGGRDDGGDDRVRNRGVATDCRVDGRDRVLTDDAVNLCARAEVQAAESDGLVSTLTRSDPREHATAEIALSYVATSLRPTGGNDGKCAGGRIGEADAHELIAVLNTGRHGADDLRGTERRGESSEPHRLRERGTDDRRGLVNAAALGVLQRQGVEGLEHADPLRRFKVEGVEALVHADAHGVLVGDVLFGIDADALRGFQRQGIEVQVHADGLDVLKGEGVQVQLIDADGVRDVVVAGSLPEVRPPDDVAVHRVPRRAGRTDGGCRLGADAVGHQPLPPEKVIPASQARSMDVPDLATEFPAAPATTVSNASARVPVRIVATASSLATVPVP